MRFPLAKACRLTSACRLVLAVMLLACLGLASGCGSVASQGLNAQGVRLFQQNRYQEAMVCFQQAIDNDPLAADGYYNMAAAYHRLGTVNRNPADLQRARNNYDLALSKDPNHREAYRGLAVLLVEQDRSEEAFRLLEGWAAQAPALAEPKIELARLLEEFGDPEGAKQRLVDALAANDKHPRALAALGRLREQSGDRQQALLAYQRSLTADTSQPEVAARVASLQSAIGATPVVTAGTADGTRPVSGGTPTWR